MSQGIEGYLQRSSNTLHQWHKLSYYKINLGAEKSEFVKVNSDGKTTVKHTFSKNNSDILVVPVSKNPRSNNFLAFHILNAKNRKRIATYRANNIADMRRFMRALGGVTSSSTELLLSNDLPVGEGIDSASVSTLMLASRNLQEERLVRFKSYECLSLQPDDEIAANKILLARPPTYQEVISQLPLEYYYPEGMSIPEPIIQHASSEVIETDSGSSSNFDKEGRRPWNDTFLPPHGSPVMYPISIGYGLEIGYKSGYQALWEPATQKVYYADHVGKKTMAEIRCSSPYQSYQEAPSSDAATADNESSKNYKIKLTRMQIVGWDVDSTFKPNECIEVFNINIKNAGESPLPAGSKLSIPSNPLVRFENASISLPALEADESYDLHEKLYGRIFDNPSPNEAGPFSSEVDFSPVLHLPNGYKKKLFTMQQKIKVEYPIKLQELKSPPTLLPGELGIFEITLCNVSNSLYGSDGKGTVEIGICLDCRLLPTTVVSDTNDSAPYVISFDPSQKNSYKVEVKEIRPKESLTIQLAMKMEKQAEVFDQCLWQASLFFRKKLVEYNFSTVRVAPLNNTYDPNSDIVIVTKALADSEYVFWQHLFKSLTLSVCTWNPKEGNLVNTIKMSTIARPVSKLILYQCSDVDQLPSKDLIAYLQGNNEEELPHTNINIAVMVPTSCSADDKQAIEQKILDLIGLDGLPTDDKKSKRKSKSLINIPPDRSPSMTSLSSSREVLLHSGSVMTYVMPLSSNCKFILIDGIDTSINVSSLSISDIPLESNYGQAFLALLESLTLAKKLQLYENEETEGNFGMPNSLSITASDILILCIAYDICEKAVKLSAEPKVLQELLHEVQEEDHLKAYRLSKAIKHQAMEASEREKAPKIRKVLEQIMHTCHNASRHLRGKRKEIEKFKLPTLKQILNLYTTAHQQKLLQVQ